MASPLRVRAQAVLTVIAGCVPVATGPPAPEPPPPEVEPPPLTAPESEVPEPEPELAAPVVGVMLPMSGSPFMREYSELIEEGVRAAVASASERDGLPVVQVIDSGRGVDQARRALAELEAAGLSAIVGPLQDAAVARVAEGRRRPVPMIAPAARELPEGQAGVYSLAGPDPGPARALGRAAWEQGIRRVVAIAPSTAYARFEVETFREAFRLGGGALAGAFYYPPGQVDFRAEVGELIRIDPDAVLLPLPSLPAMDIPQVAGQVQHYGLDDSLSVDVLGTAGWSTPDVLRDVDVNFTEGVLTVTARPPGRPEPAYEDFVRAYETVHRKSLRSDVPALGWDIMGLLLAAFRTGARAPDEVRAALEEIDGFEGATGTLAVENGRITRVYEVVVIRDRELVRVY
ncbi:MAG: penicillin-binding protein activator [Gammaproteobacteria bacterium]|nr:penicillin-binding protein activator [Gammaproteobacteria bacterium]